jgi:TrbC/VIRB2 pilin
MMRKKLWYVVQDCWNALPAMCVAVLMSLSSLAVVQPAYASGSTAVFTEAEGALKSGYSNTRSVIIGLAGLALLGLGASALFGRFSWSWFLTIVGACGLIVLSDKLIIWLTGYNVMPATTGS